MKRFLRRIPRPSLLWLSQDDVLRVRNQFIGLYLDPAQDLSLPTPPEIPNGNYYYSIYLVGGHGSDPRFHWYQARDLVDAMAGGNCHKAWLKIDSDGVPYWQQVEQDESDGTIQAERYDFKDKSFRHLALIIKHLSRYFPFVATDNYLMNGGKPIA